MGLTIASAVTYLSIDQKGRATLPEQIRHTLGLRPGDLVILERTERGTYELVPANLMPRDQLWFHHPEMRRRVRKAESDVVAGRTMTTRSMAEARSLLDGLKGRPRKPT